MRNEDPQIGVDDDGDWDETPAFDRVLFAIALLVGAYGLLVIGGVL